MGGGKATPEYLILAPTRELALQIHNEARKVSSRFLLDLAYQSNFNERKIIM